MSGGTGADEVWTALRARTSARIGLGRAGWGLPTRHRLELQGALAEARDAVHAEFRPERVEGALRERGLPGAVRVRSAAADRLTYLQRPDLGRRLADGEAERLAEATRGGPWDVVLVVADGLSVRAVHAHAAPLLGAVAAGLAADGTRVAPVVLASQARVALGDEVAAAVRAPLVAVLIGERPGLSAADSLGVYLTLDPRPGRTVDAERNCVSNVRPPLGLSYEAAAHRLVDLMRRARRLGRTGVALKAADDPPGGGAAQIPDSNAGR
ncbi:ethanolamine ammonia-lyase [Mangrovactinospora gilvigrisea]|uniref:Ethanolamine ammonia-lyase small subunit n=1 Tax=Mangrovactinospora gilvigrisea TaxID=1428644 RepID=A0A1J7C7L0_9ACTN|nr:ethanolamine ammonia-lyase subunit EutC [Mangrovactinospora gilvigrisea]OIV37528.1 ethanolamine ammonia-lyase [Mangrovactinospora gilvigrisea]